MQIGNTPSNLLTVPVLREVALINGWSDNNCFGGMGTCVLYCCGIVVHCTFYQNIHVGRHSWYRMEDYEATNCEIQVPVFGLWNRKFELQGFGFSVSGTTRNPHFEKPPTAAVQVL